MVAIMRAQTTAQPRQAAFYSASSGWGGLVLFFTLAGLTASVWSVTSGTAPQRPTAVMVETLDYDWYFDKSEGKKLVDLLIAPPGGFPNPLRMDAVLSKQVSRDWEVEHVLGFLDAQLKREINNEGPAVVDGSTRTHYVGRWRHLGKGPYCGVSAFTVQGHARKPQQDTSGIRGCGDVFFND